MLAQVGLTETVEGILGEPSYRAQVLAEERFAYDNGMNGVPTLVFANKYLVVGAQPLDVLKQITAQVRAENDKPNDAQPG